MAAVAALKKEVSAPPPAPEASGRSEFTLFGREVGARMKMLREPLGLRHEDVAEMSKEAAKRVAYLTGDDPSKGTFARVAYTNYENGKVTPGPEKIFTIAEILGTTAQWLYFGDDPNTADQVMVPHMDFNGHGFEPSGQKWGLNQLWLDRTFAAHGVTPDNIAVAVIENRSPSLYPGDAALVDVTAKPSEDEHVEFVFAHAKAIMAGDLLKVDGGYQMFDEKGRKAAIATPQQIRILGRVLGSVGSSI